MDPTEGYGKAAATEDRRGVPPPIHQQVVTLNAKAVEVLKNNRAHPQEIAKFHQRFVGKGVCWLISNLQFYNTAPLLYRLYFPIVLLWRNLKSVAIANPRICPLLEELLIKHFIDREHLSSFTAFFDEDPFLWGTLLSGILNKTTYADIFKPEYVWAFLEILHTGAFLSGSYLAFLARHIKNGRIELSTGVGTEGVLNWLEELKDHSQSHEIYESILSSFPFEDYQDMGKELLKRESTEIRVGVTLAYLLRTFTFSNPLHWALLKKGASLLHRSPPQLVKKLIDNIRSSQPFFSNPQNFHVEKKCLNDGFRQILLNGLEVGSLQLLESSMGKVFEESPLTLKEQDQLLKGVLKVCDGKNAIEVKRLFFFLVQLRDFPLFWSHFPLFTFPIDVLGAILTEVARLWPESTFNQMQQQAHNSYLEQSFPSVKAEIQAVHFFPNQGSLPSTNELDTLIVGEGTISAYTHFIAISRSAYYFQKVNTSNERQVILLSMITEVNTNNSLENWRTVLYAIKLFLFFPKNIELQEAEYTSLGIILYRYSEAIPQWNEHSKRLSHAFILHYAELIERFPLLLKVKLISLTMAIKAALTYAVTPLEKLETLETVSFIVGKDAVKIAAILENLGSLANTPWKGKAMLRAALAFASMQTPECPFPFSPPKIIIN